MSKAKSAGYYGKVFEKEVKDSIPDYVYYHRIKDPASSFGGGGITRFSLSNEFDSFLYCKPNMAALELKSTKNTSISFARDKSDKGKMIKYSQIQSLSDITKYDIKAGFLFNFRETENTYFLDIIDFNRFLGFTSKKSINEKDIIAYNGILIESTKKKVRHIYNLEFLWKES